MKTRHPKNRELVMLGTRKVLFSYHYYIKAFKYLTDMSPVAHSVLHHKVKMSFYRNVQTSNTVATFSNKRDGGYFFRYLKFN